MIVPYVAPRDGNTVCAAEQVVWPGSGAVRTGPHPGTGCVWAGERSHVGVG